MFRNTCLALILSIIFAPFLYAEVFSKKVCIKNICTQAEVVDRILKLQQGLMFRKSLSLEKSMLFVFKKEDYHDFWMKNMNFPLDIIWINKDKFIVGITKNAQPCLQGCETFTVQEKVKYVLEVISGFADKYQIRVGDKVEF